MKIRLLFPHSENDSFSLRFFTGSRNQGHYGNMFYFNEQEGAQDITFVLEDYERPIKIDENGGPVVYLCAETSFEEEFARGSLNREYLAQFDACITPYHIDCMRFIQDYPFIPPMLDVVHGENSFRDRHEAIRLPRLKNSEVIHDQVAIICSTKAYSLGHKKRLGFVKYLIDQDPSLFEWFGSGVRPFSSKKDILLKYKYVLSIENVVCDRIVSEKLLDPLLVGNTVFYIGSRVFASQYQNRVHVLDLDNPEASLARIREELNSETNEESMYISDEDMALWRSNLLRKHFIVGRIEEVAARIMKEIRYRRVVGNVILPRKEVIRNRMKAMSRIERALLKSLGCPDSTRFRSARRLIRESGSFFYY